MVAQKVPFLLSVTQMAMLQTIVTFEKTYIEWKCERGARARGTRVRTPSGAHRGVGRPGRVLRTTRIYELTAAACRASAPSEGHTGFDLGYNNSNDATGVARPRAKGRTWLRVKRCYKKRTWSCEVCRL